MQAVIMAGGKGTRLFSLTNDEIPKPMVSVCGSPILEHQINVLKENGINDFILIVGYKHEKIVEHFGDGKRFGINIQYIVEEELLGTAGSFYYLSDLVKEDFLLVFGDIIFDVDISRMLKFHESNKAAATLFVHPNSHPFDSDLIILDENQKVIGFDSKNNTRDYYYDNCVNAGIYLLNREVILRVDQPHKTDLEKDILFKMIGNGERVFGYLSPEYVKDVGTPERLMKAETDITNGFVKKRNLSNPQKCIFLDRDGTVNQYKGLIYREEDLELEECAAEAIKNVNNSEYLCIIITNQPVVARNLCTMERVQLIHNKLKTLLGNQGVYVDDIIFCPHHPDKGYPEENPLYKVDCHCRKPKTGMIQKCVEKYNIDLSRSWMIGDTSIDIQTGTNAGLHTILVETGESGKDGKHDVIPDKISADLLRAVEYIKGGNGRE